MQSDIEELYHSKMKISLVECGVCTANQHCNSLIAIGSVHSIPFRTTDNAK